MTLLALTKDANSYLFNSTAPGGPWADGISIAGRDSFIVSRWSLIYQRILANRSMTSLLRVTIPFSTQPMELSSYFALLALPSALHTIHILCEMALNSDSSP
jgi:hypothetical protein